jgi:flagellar hook-associated protein 3 FlgL
VTLRVTQRSISASSSANLQHNLLQMQRLQEQLSSGRQLGRPSDSPTGTVSALRLRADLRRGEQLVRNANDGIGWLATADTTLTQGLEALGRVRELALRGRNAAMGDEDRAAIATEVEGLRDHLLALANTTYLGRPVFSGTSAAPAAYDATGTYQGDTGAISRTVLDGVSVQVNVTGPEVFGPAGADVFSVLTDLADHLRLDPTQLDGDVSAIDARMLDLKTGLAQVGARYHQVETMRDRTEGARLDAQNALAEVESVDLPKAITELKLQEVAYQAALAATSRVIQPSLVDFLR